MTCIRNDSLNRLCSMNRRWPLMCSSRLWICEAWEKPAPCLCTDCVEKSPGISGPSPSSRIGLWPSNSGWKAL